MYKEILSLVAIGLTFAAFIPYIRSIKHQQTRPHVFSWFIWGSTTFVVFLAQLADKGGVGAWPIGVSGIVTLYIAYLAYCSKAVISITRTDWLFLLISLSALPFWYVTSDPLWAVIILTTVDLLGFGPTYRKAWHQPYSEVLVPYAIIMVRNILAAIALEHYSLTTLLFPVALAIACVLFIVMVKLRRIKFTG
ncbi:MAG: hypothetical protein OEY52_00585 [Gammaproteobacteria bacterium]|nr:hypothetical protein [Gammaproteobacteria bacterium]